MKGEDALPTWDVFHSEQLEVERGLSVAQIRDGLSQGKIRDDDLIRPSGTNAPWARLADTPEVLAPEPLPLAELDDRRDTSGETPAMFGSPDDEEDLEILEEDLQSETDRLAFAAGPNDLSVRGLSRDGEDPASSLELVTWDDDLDEEEFDPQEEDEAAAEFTLSRGSADTVEELDLAAMVDVAFQLVLFFLVTATTILYKSLEVPKPNPETNPPAAAAQGRSKSLEDLKDDFILVEIDPAGAVKIDREPVASDMSAMVGRLREARERTGRKAMLLSADFSTPHKSAVLAYDAANEIGLGIAIARPTPGPGAAQAPASGG